MSNGTISGDPNVAYASTLEIPAVDPNAPPGSKNVRITAGALKAVGTADLPVLDPGQVLGNKGSLSDNAAPAQMTEMLDAMAIQEAGVAIQGQVLFRTSSSWTALPPGTAGYVLTTNGGTADVSWAAPSFTPPAAGVVVSDGTILSPATLENLTLSGGTLTAGGGAVPGAGLVVSDGTVLDVATLDNGLTLTSSTLGLVLVNGGNVTITNGNTLSVPNSGTGTVTSIVAGGMLSGGTITGAGTIGLAAPAAGVVLSDGTVLSGATLGSHLTLAAGTLDATGFGSGTVTSVVASTGLSGGTITGSGTIALATRTASTLMGNPGTAAATPIDITIGAGLTLSTGGTLAATGGGGSGSVTSIVAGGLLSGGTITTSGTISLAAPSAGLVYSTGSALSTVTTATGVHFSSGTLSVDGASTAAFTSAMVALSAGAELGAL